MPKWCWLIVLAITTTTTTILVGGGQAWGQDFIRETIPSRWIARILPEDLPELEYRSYHSELDKARMQAFAGRYRKALYTLWNVEQQADADPVEVSLIKGAALAALGRKDEALAVLSADGVAGDPSVQISRARVLADLGRHTEALRVLAEHLERNPRSIHGHFYVGWINEEIGNHGAARDAYGWIVEGPEKYLAKWQGQGETAFENAEEVTLIGRALDRWASITGAYQNNRPMHDVILDMFVRAYDVIDRDYWPAHVAAAEYFLSHDDREQAVKELQAAQVGNPNDIRSLELLGQITLDSFNFDGCDEAIRRIRAVDADAIEAELLTARNQMHQRNPQSAIPPLEKVLKQQPNQLEALGLLAAANALQLNDERANQVLRQIEQLDPDNATAYFEVAEQLGAMRQYPRAAEMYKIAIDRAPWWTSPRNGLGLLYTQSGDEDDALAVLDAAHALDPFNLRTTNYLRLLDGLQKFARKETDHFIILYDAELDPMIPGYFSDYLESIYREVCDAFNHEPDVKTIIEVFPTHDAFSVRTTGSPWIGTVGASTGRVIAMVAPRKGSKTMGPFNWAQVLRHEFTHTVTLSATDNRIAHWMTEGLAVVEERSPLRWDWVPMLYHAVTNDELFTMDGLTWGFVRPRRPHDRTLAYAQSYWICMYIEETYGRDALLKMMEEFRNGQHQENVFPKILGRTTSQFTEEFFVWTKKQVAGWGYDEETTAKYEEIRTRGEDLIKTKQYAEAIKAWDEALKLRPMDPLPRQRLAGLYLRPEINQPEKAAEQLIRLHQVESKDNRYAKRVAGLYRDLNRLDDATTYAMQAVYIDPYDTSAHQMLAELYEQTGKTEQAQRERQMIGVLEKWHESNRKESQVR